MNNQNILITGARQGIAREYAFTLAKRGHTVFATTKTDEQAEALREEVHANNLTIRVERLDICNADDYQKGIDFTPDVLINNAAIGESGPVAEVPMERLRANMETNVYGTLALTQAIIENMIARQSGRIIIISSLAGRMVVPYVGPYAMTKFALEGAGDALRQELKHHGIAVSLVEPGAIDTGFNERMIATKYEWFDDENLLFEDADRMHPYERLLTQNQHPPKSVTPAILHAVESNRPKTRYVTPFWPYAPLTWFATKLLPDRVRDWLTRKVANTD